MLPLYPNNIKLPILTLTIIVINIIIFIYLLTLNEVQLTQVYYQYGIVPALSLKQGHYLNFITYGLIHDNFLHLLGNMWLLWLSGSILETNRAKALYIAIMIFSAVITGVAFCLANTGSTRILIGLSGVIASVIGYVFATANNTVRTYIFPVFIIDVNVKALSAIWLAIQCFLMAYYPQSEIAFISHITGFVVGAGMGVLTWGTQYNLSNKGG